MAFRDLLGIEAEERAEGRAKLLFRAKDLVAEARARRKGKRFTVLETEVTQQENGEHVAYATATFTIVST